MDKNDSVSGFTLHKGSTLKVFEKVN